MDSEPVPNVRRRKLQRAVIEAAEACKDELDYVLKLASKLGVDYPKLGYLILALQAMQAERGE